MEHENDQGGFEGAPRALTGRQQRQRPYGKRYRLAAPLRPLAGALRFELVSRDYYSPLPDLDSLPAEHWADPSELRGISFDLDAQLRFLDEQLGPHLKEFRPPHAPTGDPGQFFLDNSWYRSVEAEVLYGLIRHLKPRRIVELGSGYSTLLIAAACVANEAEGSPADYRVYDPYPETVSPALEQGLDGLTELARISATEVHDSPFAEFEPGDVLFVDTTHTVKLGSDVNHIVLDLLPRLPEGTYVHFHDMFLPWDYPRHWVEVMERYWAEQYLVQAFLSCNQAWEVVLATFALTRARPHEVARLIPSFDPDHALPDAPSAFWIRHRMEAGDPAG